MNLLIPYVPLYDHNDPSLEEFTYGDARARGRKLKRALNKGDYVFFHTNIRGKKYITAYYVVDRVLKTAEAIKDKNIVAKHRNPHILEFLSGKRTDKENDVVVFGDPITSRRLERPLLLDKTLTKELSLSIKFAKGQTEAQVIGSATRAWRELNDKDIEILLHAIMSSQKRGISPETILSTDEVTEIIERDIENFIEVNPGLIGERLKVKRRQVDSPVGRIDLLLQNERGNLVVVELKLNRVGRDAVNQLRRYINWTKKQSRKEVSGVLVCKGVMPAFQEEFKKLNGIKIFSYGWQLKVHPWNGAE